ncbi:hypothetical protein HMPREF0083_03210 [Aneurinibacillus aneurinilyticus ATCC 12856]|uniref:Uncharacterized protein n=1 Tax=Aneurinibacillus aneurinilyticus ATCC 12856 TaxID=649747 RepID=U1X2D9_ANEAE|nr:hypothetical protein HMPREF0083_03210 [Aneurinibacillus aneurinilyticus ATCC 12856]
MFPRLFLTRKFGARCGGDPLWIILDNQHPWVKISNITYIGNP